MKEVVALPPKQVFHVSRFDPHPPPYLRALLSFEWCRQVWGQGVWDDWEREWRMLYPLREAGENARLLERGRRALPGIARALFEARFAVLGGKSMRCLFELEALSPFRLERVLKPAKRGGLDLTGLPIGAQIAVFRLARERNLMNEAVLDWTMTSWLRRLGGKQGGADVSATALHLAAGASIGASI